MLQLEAAMSLSLFISEVKAVRSDMDQIFFTLSVHVNDEKWTTGSSGSLGHTLDTPDLNKEDH